MQFDSMLLIWKKQQIYPCQHSSYCQEIVTNGQNCCQRYMWYIRTPEICVLHINSCMYIQKQICLVRTPTLSTMFIVLTKVIIGSIIHRLDTSCVDRLIIYVIKLLSQLKLGALVAIITFCNISLLRTPDVTYSLRTLVCKWTGSLYVCLLHLWILMMRLWITMLCYVFFMYRQVLFTGFSWVFNTIE